MSVPALPTSIGVRRPARASRSPAPRIDDLVRAALDERAERLRRRASVEFVSVGVEVVADPHRLGGHRAEQRGAVRDRLVRRAASASPRSRRAGSKRDVHGRRHRREPEAGDAAPSARSAAGRRRPRGRPRRSRRRATGDSAMSEMLMPRAPSASASSATTPGRFGTATRSSRTGAAGQPGLEQRAGGRRAAASCQAASRAPSPRSQRRADLAERGDRVVDRGSPARRGWRGRCPPTAPGWRPPRASRRGSSGRSRGSRSPSQRARGLGDEHVGQHVRQVRDGGHQRGRGSSASIDGRPRAERGDAAGAGARAGRPRSRARRRQVPGRALEEVLAGVLDARRLGARQRVAADEALVVDRRDDRALRRADVGDDAVRPARAASTAPTVAGQRADRRGDERRVRAARAPSASESRPRRRRRARAPRARRGVRVPAADVRAEPLARGQPDRPADEPDAEDRDPSHGRRPARRAPCPRPPRPLDLRGVARRTRRRAAAAARRRSPPRAPGGPRR